MDQKQLLTIFPLLDIFSVHLIVQPESGDCYAYRVCPWLSFFYTARIQPKNGLKDKQIPHCNPFPSHTRTQSAMQRE
jgi:hypothetical protein